MSGPAPGRPLLARLAAAALLLAWSLPAHAYTKGQEQYVTGVRAFEEGDFARAAELLGEALREDPREALQKFRYKGLNAEDYLPHFHLGRALERLGRRDEALRELQASRAQGEVLKRPGLARILEASIRRLEPPAAAPEAEAAPPAGPRSEPEIALPVTPSAPPAVPTAAAPAAPGATPEAPRTAVAGEKRPGTTASPLPARRWAPERLAPALATAVREGIGSFFLGDYAAAVARLEPCAREAATARLFLAYARAGLYLTARQRDAELLRRARADHAEAARAGLPPAAERLVSPAIRELLSEDVALPPGGGATRAAPADGPAVRRPPS